MRFAMESRTPRAKGTRTLACRDRKFLRLRESPGYGATAVQRAKLAEWDDHICTVPFGRVTSTVTVAVTVYWVAA